MYIAGTTRRFQESGGKFVYIVDLYKHPVSRGTAGSVRFQSDETGGRQNTAPLSYSLATYLNDSLCYGTSYNLVLQEQEVAKRRDP